MTSTIAFLVLCFVVWLALMALWVWLICRFNDMVKAIESISETLRRRKPHTTKGVTHD